MTDASSAIARLRELRAKATAGPLVYASMGGEIVTIRLGMMAKTIARDVSPEDAAPIVAAMNSLESLLECAEALADLSSWFTTPQVGGQVWMIPAGERGADDAVKQARAALDALSKDTP
jgi:hypothetical protein